MTSRLTPASDQLSSNLPTNQLPRAPNITRAVSTRKLHDAASAAIHTTSTLLKDTKWPVESNDAAQTLLETISNLPNLPADNIPFEDTAEHFVQALEAAFVSVKNASEKYGERKRGFRDGVRHNVSLLRPGKCTKILQTCKEDVEKISAVLRGRLERVQVQGEALIRLPDKNTAKGIVVSTLGSPRGVEMPSGLQAHSTALSAQAEGRLEPSISPSDPKMKSEEQLPGSDHPTSHPASIPQSSPEVPADQEDRRPIRDGVIIAAKKTFEVVETISGAIPGVGDFVGVAAKVGLAFVGMIETMDQNEDVSKELASHTSKLSTYLEHFKKKSGVDKDDEFVTQIDNIHKELGFVQKKVSIWNSSGRLTKAFLAGDHAEELKGYQDTVQNVLEEMQLLVSLKTADVVIELKNSEIRAERRRLLDRLGDGSYGARGNCIEDVICLPGTRVGILGRINAWIKDTSASTQRALWIRGMAGRGKSAIASTVAHNWASKGSCAIFHFRRGQNVLDGQFVCALARQLGKGLVPEVKNAILDCVGENEDIARERLDQQFKTLLVGSFGKLQDYTHPVVIIVDALDECSIVTDAIRFIRLIDQHSSFIPTNVKFLLTCRPEAPLLAALEARTWHTEDLDSISDLSEDITLFVRHAFEQIRDDHRLPKTWPSRLDLKGIVEMSQGLFQWARTAIIYIGQKSPADRLQDLLRHWSTWSGLDELYHQILSKAFKEVETDSMRTELLSWVLGTLVVAPYPVSLDVIALLYADHRIFAGRGNIIHFLRNDILADLNSLLHIPTSQSEPVRLMHTSIHELLTTKERCKNHLYFANPTENHHRLAGISLQIMRRALKQNICHLSDLSKANSAIQDEVDRHVSQGLRYCCRSWSAHLAVGVMGSETTIQGSRAVFAEFKLLSEEKLLCWLEVMSLIKSMGEASTMAMQVYQWLLHHPHEMSTSDLKILWNDAQRFIAIFFEPISFGALHIYASALPFCPVGTMLWAKYGTQAITRILLGKRELSWQANIWTSSANSSVYVVAFSPNGNSLASGSANATVQLWDALTGAPLGDPLTGHSSWITSIIFSPNGKVLASVSQDKTIRLWNAQTGAPLGVPLTGHSGWIRSVAFSPDGTILASGSDDKTVRLWDTQTGVPLGVPLIGHSNRIKVITFSPDGRVLASGSVDMTVRLWNTQTGAPLVGPLIGHRDLIRSVAFSPDGTVLASRSDDEMVLLWSVASGAQLAGPLIGKGSVTSVVFSPDNQAVVADSFDKGTRLGDAKTNAPPGDPHSEWIRLAVPSPNGKVVASGSGDKTVQLWDVRAGTPLGDPLTGHSDLVRSVAFSPDGTVLASGSDDETVRLWSVPSGAPLGDPLIGHSGSITSLRVVFPLNNTAVAVGCVDEETPLRDAKTSALPSDPPTGHSDLITSVVFSPDGKVLASGSADETIRLWDMHTGAPIGGPLTGHQSSITSVIFSPDGKIVASGSLDETVRLWDVHTGMPLVDPLTGHHNWIRSVSFSPDSKVLASGSHDKTIRLWNAQTGALLCDPLIGHTDAIRSIVFSPDGKLLASGSDDKTVQLWDAQTGAPLGDPLAGHTDAIRSIVFSPDGKRLASGSDDKTVRLWDAQTRALLGHPLTGHSDSITSVSFSSEGKILASGSDSGMVQLWDPFTCQIWNGLPGNFGPRHVGMRANWVVCDSKHFMWLPVHYQQRPGYVKASSFGKIAFWSGEALFIFDAPHYLKM